MMQKSFALNDHSKKNPRRHVFFLELLLLIALVASYDFVVVIPTVQALYVSYEELNLYKVGDRVPIIVDKLTSPVTFAPIDYSNLPLCMAVTDSTDTTASSSRKWHDAISALHGDAHHPLPAISLTFGYDQFCASVCSFAGLTETDPAVVQYHKHIRNDYYYNILVDGLPAAYQSETDETLGMNYWGGIPVGNMQQDLMNENARYNISIVEGEEMILVNNHWNIQIWYRPSSKETESYSIVRVAIEPFSVQQEYETGTMASCDPAQTANPVHTSYDVVYDIPVQQLISNQPFRFTYDVTWIEASEDVPHKKRWDIYLAMDGAIPNYVEFAGFFLGGFILVAITSILITWVLRDLSYKPIIDQQLDDEVDGETTTDMTSVQVEVQMWPLSNRIFFPPTRARLLLCIACGTGAQLLMTTFCFVVLFRAGIVSQSQGARIISPGIVLYALSSVVGGYVTARLYAIFHGDFKIALVASLVTAIAYPLIGLVVVCIVYDILPLTDAPKYDVSSKISYIITLWICFMWPMTVMSGYFGYKGGSIQNFPVSEGSAGYHDLNLQNDKKDELVHDAKNRWFKWNRFTTKYRIPILLSTGGLLPILSCFVNYSYGVAGPMLLRYYSVRPYMLSSFTIFILLSGIEAVLLFYRQIRTQPNSYEWWWATFSTAGSAGIYIFLLSISYILFRGEGSNLGGSTVVLYIIWFAFISLGVILMTGFMGVALNICFIRTLYTYIMNRQQ